MCRRIQSSGVEYAVLEPEPLLRELEAHGQPQLPRQWEKRYFPTMEEEIHRESQAVSHPWMRLLAARGGMRPSMNCLSAPFWGWDSE